MCIFYRNNYLVLIVIVTDFSTILVLLEMSFLPSKWDLVWISSFLRRQLKVFSIPPSVWLFPGFPCGSDGEESTLQCGRPRFNPWVGKIPWRRAWQCTPVFLPGEPHGQRSLVATVHGVTKSQTRLKLLSMHAWLFPYHLDCTKIPGLWSDKKLTGRWGGPAQALAVFSLEAGWSPCGTPCPELAWDFHALLCTCVAPKLPTWGKNALQLISFLEIPGFE